MSTMRPVVVLMLDEDIAALSPYLDDLFIGEGLSPRSQANGWTVEMLRWGVLFHALGTALVAGDIELERIPNDASELLR